MTWRGASCDSLIGARTVEEYDGTASIWQGPHEDLHEVHDYGRWLRTHEPVAVRNQSTIVGHPTGRAQ